MKGTPHCCSVQRVLVSLAILIAATVPSLSIENPVEATGFTPTSIHESYGNDSVNLLNGNLTMVFPFINGLPVQGGKLDMGMSGVYNSKIWRATTGVYSRAWSIALGNPTMAQFYSEASSGELGVGWTMNFGYILSEESAGKYIGAIYYAPDGAKHSLKLESSATNTYVADDGSFIRAMAQFTETDYWGVPIITSWILQYPNGIIHELTHAVELGFPYRTRVVNGWYPEKISDPNGNSIDIEYHTDYPKMIRRIRTHDDDHRDIFLTVTEAADRDCTDAEEPDCDPSPPQVIFEETFDQDPDQLFASPAYPVENGDTPDWASLWSRRNGQFHFPGTSWMTMMQAPCTGYWVHIHHPDEADFIDCAQDNTDPANPDGSLYFGRDNQGTYSQDCTYDYRMDFCASGAASADKREKLHIKAVTPVIADSLPANAFLSFDFLRQVRPRGPRPTPSAGNVNWDSDSFEIWVETVDSIGGLVGQLRLAQVNNLSQSQGRWLSSGPLDLNAFAGERIRIRFEFDASQHSGSSAETPNLDRDHLGLLVDNVRVETGGSSANHVEGLYDAAFIQQESDPAEDPEVNPDAYTKVDFIYTERSVENALAERDPVVKQDVVLLREVRFAPDDPEIGDLHIEFDYNEYGELNKVVYPTGGVARYDYGTYEAPSSTEMPAIMSTILEQTYGGVVHQMGSWSFTPHLVADGTFLGWAGGDPISVGREIPPGGVAQDPFNRWWFQMTHRGVTAKYTYVPESDSISYLTYERDSGVFDVFTTGKLRLNPRYCAVLRHKSLVSPPNPPASATPVPGDTSVVETRVYHYLAPEDLLSTDTDDDVGADSGLLRKVEYYAGEATYAGWADAEGIVQFNGGGLRREEWTTYDHMTRNLIFWDVYNGQLVMDTDMFRRVDPHEVEKETVYVTDLESGQPVRTKQVLSGYSVGNYQATEYWDTFDDGATYTLRRREETHWTPDTAPWWSQNFPGWLLKKWDRRWRMDVVQLPDGTSENQYAYTEAKFDAKGNIEELVQRGDEANLDADLDLHDGDTKVTYTYDAKGLVTEELYEVQEANVPVRKARVKNLYAYGSLIYREYVDELGASVGQPIVWRDIDPVTGRVMTEWSPWGMNTDFSYDALGRITMMEPTDFATGTHPELATNIIYIGANATVVYRGPAEDPLALTIYGHDGLGRLTTEMRVAPHPDDPGETTTVKRITDYDVLGRKHTQSEWVEASVSDPPGTVWEYDLWDRPTSATYADHSEDSVQGAGYRKTTYDYTGTREVVVTQSLATEDPATAQESFEMTQVMDSLGRLREVDSSAGGGVRAKYTYDVGDRLSWVELDDGTLKQYREFSYDDTGRLRYSVQPEAGRVEYRDYEPFGNPTVIEDERGDTEGYWFENDYDDAGRLTALQRSDPGQGQNRVLTTLSEMFYDEAGHGDSKNLPTRIRSYADDGTYLSTRKLYYLGPMGQLSREGTEFADWSNGNPSEELQTTYDYNNLGELSDILYPVGASENRDSTDLALTYSHGMLDRVDSPTRGTILASATYNPAGGPRKLTFGNGLETVVTPDARNRPSQITFQDPGTGQTYFDTGLYAYDGSSNITAIGADTFHYDGHSRLKSASIVNSVPSPRTFSYGYDGFGNMTSKQLNAGVACDAVCLAQRDVYDFTGRSYVKPDPGNPPGLPTNQIEDDPKFAYDDNGNLTVDGLATHEWDTRNRMKSRTQPGGTYQYAYDASGYRIFAKDLAAQRDVFYLRDSQGQVLTEYARPWDLGGSEPQWVRDYIYSGGGSLATVENAEPLTPSGVYSALSSGTTAQLTWFANPETDVVGYRLYEAATAEADPTVLSTVTGTSATTSLTAPAFISVMAVDAAGTESPATATFYVQPNDTMPGPDTASVVAEQTNFVPNVLQISWAEVTGADHQGYDVFRKLLSDADYPAQPLNGDVPIHDEVYIDTDSAVLYDETYVYKLVTRDTAGNRSAGLTASVTPQLGGGGGSPGCVPGFPCIMTRIAEWEWSVEEPWTEVWAVAACLAGAEGSAGAMGGESDACREPGDDAGGAWDGLLASPYKVVGTGGDDWRVVWLHTDHLGSVRMTSTTGPEVLSYHTYEPFGWEIPSAVDDSGNTHRFTGHERDVGTGLDYMLARYHSSKQGRFLSVDPVDDSRLNDPQRWNRYSYARNNPVAFVDPFGEAITYASSQQETMLNEARDKSTDLDVALSGFEGDGAPDLILQYGDAGKDANGVDDADAVTTPNISPGYDSSKVKSNADLKPENVIDETTTIAPVITIDESVQGKAKELKTTVHEIGHADDARRSPARYYRDALKTKETSGATPWKKRPEERRAIDFKKAVMEQIKRAKK